MADISVVPNMQIFIQCVKTHTIHRRAAEDLEMLGQATGLPIQVTSSAWPGITPVILCIADQGCAEGIQLI